MNLEAFVTRFLESSSAGFTVSTLDQTLTAVHARTVRNPRAAGPVLVRCAVRTAALGVVGFALRARPDSYAATAGALGFATVADLATLLATPRARPAEPSEAPT